MGLPLEFSTMRGRIRWQELSCDEQDDKASAAAEAKYRKWLAIKLTGEMLAAVFSYCGQ